MQLKIQTFSLEQVVMTILELFEMCEESGDIERLARQVQQKTPELQKAIKNIVQVVAVAQGNVLSKNGTYTIILIDDMETVIDMVISGLKEALELK